MKKQSKLEYTDAAANQIIEAYGLDPKVKKVWKTRGHIPGAYIEEGGVDVSATLADRDPVRQRIVEILRRPEVAASKFRSLGQKGADVARGKSSLTEAEARDIEGELAEIRNKVSKVLSMATNTNIAAVLQDVRLHPTKVISAKLCSKVQDKGRKLLTPSELDEIALRMIALRALLKV